MTTLFTPHLETLFLLDFQDTIFFTICGFSASCYIHPQFLISKHWSALRLTSPPSSLSILFKYRSKLRK